MKTPAILLIALVFFCSCSDDSPSSATTPRLEISLGQQPIIQYKTPAPLIARLSGYNYLSNISVKWYFEGGDTVRSFISTGGAQYYIYFKKEGEQIVAAAAYDPFNGQRIDSTSIRVMVEPNPPKISITPKNLDTSVTFHQGYGYFIQHNVSVNVPFPNKTFSWRVQGENLDTVISSYGGLSFGYPKPNTYRINVDMIDINTKAILASDSTTLTIR